MVHKQLIFAYMVRGTYSSVQSCHAGRSYLVVGLFFKGHLPGHIDDDDINGIDRYFWTFSNLIDAMTTMEYAIIQYKAYIHVIHVDEA